MKPINITEAKTHLSRLVARVQAGEEVVIAKAGRPVARLVPLDTRSSLVKTGGLRIPGGIPDELDTMFAEEIEALFSGPIAGRGKRRKDVRHLKGLVPKPPQPVSVEVMKAAGRRAAGRK